MTALLLSLTDDECQYLKDLIVSGSVQSQVASRAEILLLKSQGVSFEEIAERMGLSTRTVQTRVAKFRSLGLEAALFDHLRPGRPAVISKDAKEWLLAAARQKPSDAGSCQGTWTLKDLYTYVQQHAERAGYPRMAAVTKAYIHKLLKDAGIELAQGQSDEWE